MIQYQCSAHQDKGCSGKLIRKRSIYGAIVTNCHRGWTQPIIISHGNHADGTINTRSLMIPASLWPEILPGKPGGIDAESH